MRKMSDLLEVGDTLVVGHAFGENRFNITRVTKTLAKSKRSDGHEHTFKRRISCMMSHPPQQWDANTYKVERGD